MEIKNKKAIIIGCGIAGPALALQLKRAGIKSTIYESEKTPSDLGLFIYLSPNGMNVIRSLGVYEKIKKLGIETYAYIFYNEKGKQLGNLDYSNEDERFGASNVMLRRSLLYKAVREEAINQGIDIQFGKKLKDIEIINSEKVIAHFEDGVTAKGNFLIGCDGLRSRTRKIIIPDTPKPRYDGIVATGGFSKISINPRLPNTFYSSFLNGAGVAHLTSKNGETFWWLSVTYPEEPTKDELNLISNDQWKQKLLDLCDGTHPVYKKFIEGHEGDFPKIPLYDIDFLETWHKGPVCLVGDAAHPTSPHVGQGASMALEDSITLAKCLRDIEDTQQAFAKFQSLRKERTEKMIKFSRLSGESLHLTSPIKKWFRDLMLSMFTKPFFLKHPLPGDRFDMNFFFGYKVDWDEKIK